jgi:hypothetical protein
MHRSQLKYRPGLLAAAVQFLSVLSVGLWSGCAEPMPPEHLAAVSKMQGLGAKVQFEDGGLRLNLGATRIEDADLAHLKDIKNLKTLDIRSTHITDKGLATLQSINSLTAVLLTGAAVTPEGIDAFEKARPDITVTR